MSVSVIIPVFNGELFLQRAVLSALSQGDIIREIILVDDCSTDRSREVMLMLSDKHSNVRLLSTPINSGPSAARNIGLRAAIGDWVAVLDADDAYIEGRILHLITRANIAKLDIVADKICMYDPAYQRASKPWPRRLPATPISARVYVNRSHPLTGDLDFGLLKPVFRRRFLEMHNLKYDESQRHGEDFLFVLECLYCGAKMSIVPNAGYLYTVRSSGWSRTAVDYIGMAKLTRLLASRPNQAAPRWALEQRARALERFHKRQVLKSIISKHPLGPSVLHIISIKERIEAMVKRYLSRYFASH